MAKKRIKKSCVEKYDFIKELGRGGNAVVSLVKSKEDGKEYALKDLVNMTQEKKNRFVDEISVMIENQDKIDGILPIFEYSKEEFWYIMPVAKGIIEYLKEKEISKPDIIRGVIQLAETLCEFHKLGVSHRDVKPSNIYYYSKRFYMGDFGLVELPDNPHDHTRSDRGLGAIFTIAPEMKRNPRDADGKKADVFSLAKTLWMLLTFDERGFDGTYNYDDQNHGLRFVERLKEIHLVELEQLLSKCTSNSPDCRPLMDEVIQMLNEWITIESDIHLSQRSEWEFLNGILFGKYPQASAIWSQTRTIVDVLNVIGGLSVYNHMFLPEGGGLDFSKAEIVNENGCIYLYTGMNSRHLVKPKMLTYEGFQENHEWNYFMLTLDEQEPILGKTSRLSEYLVEDYPGNYVSAKDSQYGVYDYETGKKLPEGYKIVNRYLNGKFLIAFKFGPYNKISATYDGRHNDCELKAFRNYIEQCIETATLLLAKGLNLDSILNNRLFGKNPFKMEEVLQEDVDFESEFITEKYVKENYDKFNFSDLIVPKESDKNIVFFVEYNDPNDFSRLANERQILLCNDGYFREIGDEEFHKVHCVYDRENAINLMKHIRLKLCDIISNQGLVDYDCFFLYSLDLKRIDKPTHLIEIEELKDLIFKADDRVNNIIVVDENGYPLIIQESIKTDTYPVYGPCWNAGNCYVGKYSSLNNVADEYFDLIEAWLMHLQSNKRIKASGYGSPSDMTTILNEIKEYY